MVTEKEKGKTTEKVAATAIQEAEIVFSSNRFYGHVTSDKESEFVEIRGYKWGRFGFLISMLQNFLNNTSIHDNYLITN